MRKAYLILFTQRLCSLLMHCCSRGNSNQPIWLDDVPCSSSDVCIADCINCPTNEDCGHSEDITVECCELCTCNHYIVDSSGKLDWSVVFNSIQA